MCGVVSLKNNISSSFSFLCSLSLSVFCVWFFFQRGKLVVVQNFFDGLHFLPPIPLCWSYEFVSLHTNCNILLMEDKAIDSLTAKLDGLSPADLRRILIELAHDCEGERFDITTDNRISVNAALVQTQDGSLKRIAIACTPQCSPLRRLATRGGLKAPERRKHLICRSKQFWKTAFGDKSPLFRYTQRHVAIQLQYDGSKYYGFSAQKDEFEETVEKHLFEALLKLRLIESRQVSTTRVHSGIALFSYAAVF
jgi:hypothetical protein